MSAPVVASLAVIPIVALAPVLNSMFGADSQFGRQAIAALASFVPVFINTLRGFRQTAPVHRDLMKAYAANSGQVLRTLTLPTARPFILTGIRIASSLAVISALVAEYFGGPRGGLGGLISTSAASSAYARAWAYVLGIHRARARCSSSPRSHSNDCCSATPRRRDDAPDPGHPDSPGGIQHHRTHREHMRSTERTDMNHSRRRVATIGGLALAAALAFTACSAGGGTGETDGAPTASSRR